MASDFDMIRDAVERHWGHRCDDFSEHCPCCVAWQAFDVITEGMDDDDLLVDARKERGL